MIKISSLVPSWGDLYLFSRSKIVKSSYFWFVFVPIVAKIIDKIKHIECLKAFSGELPALPFSWQMFFFSAMFIAIGNLIYFIRCPYIVRKYKTFEDFRTGGNSVEQLKKIYAELILQRLSQKNDVTIINNLRDFYSSYCKHEEFLKEEFNIRNFSKIISSMEIEEAKINGAFNHVSDVAQELHVFGRWMCWICYLLGMLFMGSVVVQNIYYVVLTINI